MENENENENVASDANEEISLEDESSEESTEESNTAELSARLRRAEAKIERMKLDAKVEKRVERIVEKKTGELDETQLDYLDLKGINEEDDIKIIARHVQRTGESVRQALKDEYVTSKLDANAKSREVKGATPSATKRGGNQVNDVASAIAKWEQTGELPSDFTLRSEVVNKIADAGGSRKPSWQ
jgi:hypothetical protein